MRKKLIKPSKTLFVRIPHELNEKLKQEQNMSGLVVRLLTEYYAKL